MQNLLQLTNNNDNKLNTINNNKLVIGKTNK